ncbi:hypothetical protein EMIHUDRAFT_196818 [Emiliania huxleyi CCMP1516]|uniref:YqgF/RNase H-like domain-containing protein n=2 Tax=Emiliania huxleyi TaxID=2903 RepID=A0A0D3J4R9_EMIH1|nr:hypothetical protein EMIHUDRAFT_196818 [Emiliania huxleyi CCMP1516]EOD18504.1 hypothetical protein EMIHUDRAFT_196818 [Emiliania huxleyi CCMP1516]|eukprot:XP_005770933.1 hypothetical protein EMIHUDRAFT_196818 [Emiliania huxleyi CCMP1516]
MASCSSSALSHFIGVERVLAVDMGARYCGLAARTSPLLGVQRVGVLERRRSGPSRFATQAAAICSLAAELDAGGVVLGMPYLADGRRSRECELVEAAAERLREAAPPGLRLLLWDETWTTRLALGPGRHSARRQHWGHAAAARLLLQDVLGAAEGVVRWALLLGSSE